MLRYKEFRVHESKPKRLFIMLHGVGADAEDLIGLAEMLSPYIGDCLFVSLNAPFEFDAAPFGYQWFSLYGIYGNDLEETHRQYRESSRLLKETIAALQKSNSIASTETFIMGFSQGGMMAIEYALQPSSPDLGGVILCSTRSFVDFTPKRSLRTPILILHGNDDDLIPPKHASELYEYLASHKINVQSHLLPNLAHGINMNTIDKIGEFLETLDICK